MMNKEAVAHRIVSDYAYAVKPGVLLLKLRTLKDDVESARVHVMDKYLFCHGQTELSEHDLRKAASDLYYDYYEVEIRCGHKSLFYYFELNGLDETLFYGNYYFFEYIPVEGRHFFEMAYLADEDCFQTPAWAMNAISYQVFPERFHNSTPEISPPDTKDWYSQVDYKCFLGGDLRGITLRLPYLSGLGINTLYLTPVFEASSNHKYNTRDYFKVDPHFGTLEDLKELTAKAHENGIKVILDAVFNHCGTDFFAFSDLLQKQQESAYKDWFIVWKYPVAVKHNPDYACYSYHGQMPKLNMRNPETRRYFLDVASYWIREAHIDGWRLDVASEVDHQFWREFRREVKSADPEALIVGEIWHEATAWLQGDQFDTTMNYIFTDAIKDFLAFRRIKPSEFAARLGFLRGVYKHQAYHLLWNLIGSHDTPRFLTESGGKVNSLLMAVFLQFTFTGIPMIYYGDELGMSGGPDPDCRRGMVWDSEKQDHNILDFYKKMIAVRRQQTLLNEGDFEIILTDDDKGLFGFRRFSTEDSLTIIINISDKPHDYQIITKNILTDLMTGLYYKPSKERVTVTIKPESGVILKTPDHNK